MESKDFDKRLMRGNTKRTKTEHKTQKQNENEQFYFAFEGR